MKTTSERNSTLTHTIKSLMREVNFFFESLANKDVKKKKKKKLKHRESEKTFINFHFKKENRR